VDGWHWFASMGTTGGPQAPSLALRLRNTIPGYVDGLVSGGTQTSELPPRLLMFSTQTFPFLSPSPPLPFEGAGDVGSEITGILAGAILGTSTFPGTPCFAFDHMLRLVPVFEELQQS
jgi:hypothetical protein